VQGQIVTATVNNSTSVKLISWKVSARGQITRQGETLTGAGSVVDITPSSYRRFGLTRLDGTTSVVSTWDVPKRLELTVARSP
jgi:hypothetical protein